MDNMCFHQKKTKKHDFQNDLKYRVLKPLFSSFQIGNEAIKREFSD